MTTINESYGRDLDLNLLRVFAVVAEEQNITRAAARLYVTQPAISAALRRLTQFVGADLFARQGRGIALTKRGEELLAASRTHLQPLVAAAMAVPSFDPKSSTATIRIGLGDGQEVTVLPRLLAAMREEAPNMQLVVVHAQFRSVEDLLLSNRVDLAVSVADALPKSILREVLVSSKDARDGFVCLYDSRFTKLPKKPTERDYFACEHVVVSYAGDARGIVEDEFERSRTVRVAVPAFGMVADAVDGSPLVATVPLPLAKHLAKTRPYLRYAPLPFRLDLDGTTLDLLWARTSDDDRVVAFVRVLVKRVVRELLASLRR